MTDFRFIAKYIGLGFLSIAILWHIYKGFNSTVLGLYILGILLFLSWYIPYRRKQKNG